MSQENASGAPPEVAGQKPAPEALNPHVSQPQKLLPPAKPRRAIEGPHKLPWWRRWPFWILMAALLLLVFLVIRSFSGGNAAPPPGKRAEAGASITAGKTTSGDINIYIDALGTVTPVNTVTVYSQITGRVTAVHYHEGQMVHEGDPLIDVDPRPYEATLEQAQGTLDRDRGTLAEARIDLQRYKDAFARNAIARQQMEDQEQVVVQDEGTVKADQGTVSYDQTQLSYCHIVAPVTGRVGLRLVDPGNTIFSGSGSTLVVLTQVQPITVVFNVSEDDLAQVDAQLRGGKRLAVDAFDRSNENKIASGTLTSLDNEVDTTTGTIKFRAEFPNKNLSLFPNQFVNARLLVKTLKNATLVPTSAVQHNGTQPFLYVVQPNNTVSVQQIQVSTASDQQTAVTGIAPGTTIATSGFDRLENGVPVQVKGQAGKAK
ncbi:MAG TPA: efflux RND transporter periplasmic adaptor subunit [Bryobacteraceae bacterium]|jgi:multidrug efflux system membrane fusion protein|nr:efflux RND transporter periplasmic adaptor subunit [Bryobacteraceae bacterium]